MFPPVQRANADGVVGVGGNLSPGMLLSAYRQGIFPWFNLGEPVIWWSPDPRFVVYLDEVHVSRSLAGTLRRGRFDVSFDRDFASVVARCARVPRRRQQGTWITPDMEAAYLELHRLGCAHSCECRVDGALVGGVYGVSLGRVFFGESMFSDVPDASKVAFVTLCAMLREHGFPFMDAQVPNDHVQRLGGRPIPRELFLSEVRRLADEPAMPGSWQRLPSVSPVQ